MASQTTIDPSPSRVASMTNRFRSHRLLYRAVEDEDEAFMHLVQSDVAAYANSADNLLVPETRAASKQWRDNMAARSLILVIVCLLPDDPKEAEELAAGGIFGKNNHKPIPTPIGVVGLSALSPAQRHHRHAYLSVDIARPHRSKGYGTEAILWVLDWAFVAAGLHSVQIEAFSWNEGAVQLYSRLGFTLEGRKRELYWYNGGWADLLSWGILEHEWREIKKKEETKETKETKDVVRDRFGRAIA